VDSGGTPVAASGKERQRESCTGRGSEEDSESSQSLHGLDAGLQQFGLDELQGGICLGTSGLKLFLKFS
jgi:hypothetical protein